LITYKFSKFLKHLHNRFTTTVFQKFKACNYLEANQMWTAAYQSNYTSIWNIKFVCQNTVNL